MRRLRAEQNLSTREFAHHAGLSLSTLYGLEHGQQRTVRLSTVDNLAKAFGVHVSVLLSPGRQSRRPWKAEDSSLLAAAVLVKRRKAFGLTQEELAELACVSRDILAKIECQNRNPTLEVLQRLCSALGAEMHELFEADESIR